MRNGFFGSIRIVSKSLLVLGLATVLGPTFAPAQEPAPAVDSASTAWQRYDWLKPSVDTQAQATANETITASVKQEFKDPVNVISTGALWPFRARPTP